MARIVLRQSLLHEDTLPQTFSLMHSTEFARKLMNANSKWNFVWHNPIPSTSSIKELALWEQKTDPLPKSGFLCNSARASRWLTLQGLALLCMSRPVTDCKIETQSDWGYSLGSGGWQGATGEIGGKNVEPLNPWGSDS